MILLTSRSGTILPVYLARVITLCRSFICHTSPEGMAVTIARLNKDLTDGPWIKTEIARSSGPAFLVAWHPTSGKWQWKRLRKVVDSNEQLCSGISPTATRFQRNKWPGQSGAWEHSFKDLQFCNRLSLQRVVSSMSINFVWKAAMRFNAIKVREMCFSFDIAFVYTLVCYRPIQSCFVVIQYYSFCTTHQQKICN